MKYLANKRVFANLIRSLFEKRRIHTTLAKAKAIQPMAEKRVKKTDRKGGFTRIVKLGKRRGDAAEMVILEFVDAEPVKPEVVKTKKVKETPKVQEAKVVSVKRPKTLKKPK